jgi:hypothetical protein
MRLTIWRLEVRFEQTRLRAKTLILGQPCQHRASPASPVLSILELFPTLSTTDAHLIQADDGLI